MTVARTPAQVIAGEAVSGTSQERWNDMLNIASVVVNRAAMLGVSPEDVVSAMASATQKEFDAYGKALPSGVGTSIVDMAQAALDQVQTQGPVNQATFYATPNAVDGLPSGLVEEAETTGHIFKSDPAMRSIRTALGFKTPNPANLPELATSDPLQQAINGPYATDRLVNGVTSLTAAPATVVTSQAMPAGAIDPAFSPSGLLSGDFPASSFTPGTPTLDNWGALASAGGLKTDALSLAGAAPYTANGLTNSITSESNVPANVVSSTSVPGQKWDSAFGPNGMMTGAFPGEPQTANPNRMRASDPSLSQVMQTPTAYLDAPEPHPNVNNFAEMAAAPPVQAPISVQGLLGQMQQPNLAASANVPMSASLFSPTYSNPTVESFGPVAAADPVNSPMNVPATADLGTAPSLSASAAAVPALDVPATADLGTTPALAAQTAAVPSVQTPALNNFADLAAAGPVQATQPSQFGDINSPEMQAMKANVEAQLGGMQPITATATNNNFAALAAAGPLASPVSVTPTGILGTTPALTASTAATPTGLLSGLQETPAATPAENAISGLLSQPSSLMSPTSIESQPNLSAVTPTSSMLANSVTPNYQQYQSFVPSDVQAIAPEVAPAAAPAFDPATGYQQMAASLGPTGLLGLDGTKYSDLSGNLTQNPALSMPSVPSVDTTAVADQPSLASPTDTTQSNVTVQGPATATDTTQDQANQGSFPAAPAKTSTLGGLINKGTITGGLLGSLAAGPFGGILGGVLGNQINKNGGLTGLLSGQAPNINNIGAGLANIQSVYGGAPVGTQATANNGGTVTSLGNGWTAYTNAYGVTTTEGPNGLHASWFGPSLTGDPSHTPGGPPGGGGGVGGIGGLL